QGSIQIKNQIFVFHLSLCFCRRRHVLLRPWLAGTIPAKRDGPIVSGRIAQPALRNHCIIRHRQWQINRECLSASGIYTEKHPSSSSLPGFMEQGYKDSNLEMTES